MRLNYRSKTHELAGSVKYKRFSGYGCCRRGPLFGIIKVRVLHRRIPLLASCLFIGIYGERDGKGHRFYRRLPRFTAYNANQTVTPAAVKVPQHDDEARTWLPA